MYVYYGQGEMGAVSRGIQVLEALGGGTLLCNPAFAWAAAGRDRVQVVNCGWKSTTPEDAIIFDGKPHVSASLILKAKARRFLILHDEAHLPYAALMDETFSTGDLGPGVTQVPAIVPAVDEVRAEVWWGDANPRLLVVEAGANRERALCLIAAAQRTGLPFLACSPWWPATRYWPASDLIATSDVVLHYGGKQTAAECAHFGKAQVIPAMGIDIAGRTNEALKAQRVQAFDAGAIGPGQGASVIAERIRAALCQSVML